MADDRTLYYQERDRKRQDALRAVQHAVPQTCVGCGETFYGRKRQYCGSLVCKRTIDAARARTARANWTPEQRQNHRQRLDRLGSNRRKLRICEVCGADYRPTYGEQRTCGRACGVALRRHEYGTCGSTPLCGQASEVLWASCVVCQSAFIVRRRKRHCERPITAQQCPECGSTIVGYRRKYCTKACCRRAWRRHRRHTQRVALALVPKTDWRTQPRTRHSHCLECGDLLAGKQGKWCSDACRDRAYDRHARHLARTAPYCDPTEPLFTTREIAERDGWRCHICRRKVSAEQATIDHLIPVTDGGQHVRSNVSLAHHHCNSIRSDSGAAQLLLVA